jgi:hypothetical protein
MLYFRCDVAARNPIPGPISTLGKRLVYRLSQYTAIRPCYGDWTSHAMALHMVVETDTASEEEDNRKPSASKGDTDSKGPAPDNDDLPNPLENHIRATVVNRSHSHR